MEKFHPNAHDFDPDRFKTEQDKYGTKHYLCFPTLHFFGLGIQILVREIRVYSVFCKSMDEPDTPSSHSSAPPACMKCNMILY